jgi:type III restriction enzyme
VADTRIENPILNSPFTEPTRHFRFGEEGITSEVVEGRRPSAYFVPIPQAKKKSGQQSFETEWTKDRLKESDAINLIRGKVDRWRRQGHPLVTPTTRRLLEYWTDPAREKQLFFAQVEALETAIYIAEAARPSGDVYTINTLVEAAERANPGLFRVAHKMATGSGKTVVMAMLIAWQTLNKAASPQDRRFADRFLVATPGITIRDRLRVLLPSDPGNYYRERDLVPADLVAQLGRARIVITNFHAFQRRSKAGGLTALHKKLVDPEAFVESPAEMVNRVCRELGSARTEVVVINDEAHHCYRGRPDDEKLTGDDRVEAREREEEARVWISGLEAVQAKLGIKTVYDLSATPFFLRGSGYSEGTLFPWVVSDFSLIDAIESGIVKVPRVPVADDSMAGKGVTYRDLWLNIRTHLPKRGRSKGEGVIGSLAGIPALEGALRSLYGNYEKAYRSWQDSEAARVGGSAPPVFIVVSANTGVSKLVYDWIAGHETEQGIRSGNLPIFTNAEGGRWLDRPNTILIDSRQLESGEAMSDEFKRVAASEIAEFKAELRQRFPGRDPEAITDEELLREVMNTVGKPGRLGEHVKCVVSVSMLTEGWDANTVTHILGVRAFSTQLLCEQVVGRGLRRRSYVVGDDGLLDPEYAEVYGVPFSFIPAAGSAVDPKPRPTPTRVRALESRIGCEISFPRVVGYRFEVVAPRLTASFGKEHVLVLSAQDLPLKVEVAGIVGQVETHTLDDLKTWRLQRVEFELARRLAQDRFRAVVEEEQPWLFPQLLTIVRQWMRSSVVLKDNAFPQLLRIQRFESDALDRIHRGIVSAGEEQVSIEPILRAFDPVGSTRFVDFDTTKQTWLTDETKCHVSHVPIDSGWEAKVAQTLEEMPEVVRYVKNQALGFTIPYTIDGESRSYFPDFIAVLADGTHLIVEVSGAQRRDKAEKVATTRELWLPAVNRHGGFGRWDFVEVTDPWDCEGLIRAHVSPPAGGSTAEPGGGRAGVVSPPGGGSTAEPGGGRHGG